MKEIIGGRPFDEVKKIRKDGGLLQLIGINHDKDGRISSTAWQEAGGNSYFEIIDYDRNGIPIKTIDKIKPSDQKHSFISRIRIFDYREGGITTIGTYGPASFDIEDLIEDRHVHRLKDLGFPIDKGFVVLTTNAAEESPPKFGLYDGRAFVGLPPEFNKTGKFWQYEVKSQDDRFATIVPTTPSKGIPQSLEVLAILPPYLAKRNLGRLPHYISMGRR